MSTPVVTVIVPGRDVAAYAEEALASLRAQSFTDWRAVLIDDGSVDGTGDVFAAAADADARFRLVTHSSPFGLAAARNAGLDLVDTPFVAFLDADDILTPRALERFIDTLNRTGSDMVVGAYVRLRADEDGEYHPGTVQPWVGAATSPERLRTSLAAHPELSGNIVAWSKLSRVELWRRSGLRFPEGKLYEDQIVAQRLYTAARAVDVIPDVVVHWRERADGTSITQNKDLLPVLVDYLEALRGGIAVLDAAGQRAAAGARIRLILEMDVPPLVRIAQSHPDDAYRRAVGEFVRSLHDRALADAIALNPLAADLRGAAELW